MSIKPALRNSGFYFHWALLKKHSNYPLHSQTKAKSRAFLISQLDQIMCTLKAGNVNCAFGWKRWICLLFKQWDRWLVQTARLAHHIVPPKTTFSVEKRKHFFVEPHLLQVIWILLYIFYEPTINRSVFSWKWAQLLVSKGLNYWN